jgi:chlorobactene glucosyltransferase
MGPGSGREPPIVSWDLVFDRIVPWLLVAQLGLILWNRRALARPPSRSWGTGAPAVSVLIPARNEADTIGTCLEHVLAQDYPDLEVVVLDDGSVDATADIVRSFDDPRVRLVAGGVLPDGWTGKNWACHQLAGEAAGDLLCFVDADTVLEPEAVSAAVAVIDEHGAGLMSMLPRAESRSAAAAVLLPIVTHATLGLIPISLIHASKSPSLAIAFGPFIVVTREAYDASGGHAAHPGHIVDDVQLIRSVKAAGYRVRLSNGTDLVQTRWYQDTGGIWNGFSKNAYGALGYNPLIAAFVVLVLAPLLLSPFVRFGFGIVDGALPMIVVWQVLLMLASRALTAVMGRDPLWSTPLHPVGLAFWAATLGWSAVLAHTGRGVVWKGRTMPTRSGD